MSGYFGVLTNNNQAGSSADILQGLRCQNIVGAGTLTKLEVNCQESSYGKVRLGVYADSLGSPGALLLDAGEVDVVAGWCIIDGLSLAVTLNTWYWLAFNSDTGDVYYYQSGQPADSHAWKSQSHASMPNPYGTPAGTNNNQYQIRAYVEAGGQTYNEEITVSSIPALSNSPQVDFFPSLGAFASTPALSPAAIADLLGSIGLASSPAASMIGGMDYAEALTLLSNPAMSAACLLDMFPSLVLSSDPALAASALADFYNSLTLASAPAAVMAAVADLFMSLVLASDPALTASGGMDYSDELTLSSSPAFSTAIFKEAFGELTLLSNPSLLMSNLADLLATLTLTSTPAIVAEFEGMITVVKRILAYVQDILRIKAVVQDIGRIKAEVVDLNRVKALLTDETIEELYDGGAFDAVPSGDIDCGAFEDEPDTIIDLGEWN